MRCKIKEGPVIEINDAQLQNFISEFKAEVFNWSDLGNPTEPGDYKITVKNKSERIWLDSSDISLHKEYPNFKVVISRLTVTAFALGSSVEQLIDNLQSIQLPREDRKYNVWLLIEQD